MTSGYLNNVNIRESTYKTPYISSHNTNTTKTSLYYIAPSGTAHNGINIYRKMQDSYGSLGLPQLQTTNLIFNISSTHFPSYGHVNLPVSVYDPYSATNFKMNLDVSTVQTGSTASITIHNAWIQNSSGSYNHPFTGFYVNGSTSLSTFPITMSGTSVDGSLAFPSVFQYSTISRTSLINTLNIRGTSYPANYESVKKSVTIRSGSSDNFWV